MERTFSEHMSRTQDATYSATKAGYKSPMVAGSTMKVKPEIQAEVSRRIMARLGDLGELAVATVHEAMVSPTATWTNRLTAADMVLKRLERSEGEGSKDPSEMTYDEIQATIRALQLRQADIAGEAKDITPAIDDSTPDSGVFG
jgi:phage terminase small subunit